jgi:hypothetical protein
MDEISFDTPTKGPCIQMSDSSHAEYQALRDTIRERGTVRLCAVLGGFVAWAALAIALLIADLDAGATLVPLVVLAGTFEMNFFIHTGVERIGRYIQVFYEERAGTVGWETTAMHYGATFPSGLDPLFSILFTVAATLNFFTAPFIGGRPGWIALSLVSHLAFGYRIVAAKKRAASQRALDLERFRNIAKERMVID